MIDIMNTRNNLLTIQLACDIIHQFGRDPGTIFSNAFTPYDAVSTLYPKFNDLLYSQRLTIVMNVMDYMLNCSLPDYTSQLQPIDYDYYYCFYNDDHTSRRGVIFDANSNESCYTFNVMDLVDAKYMINEFDVLRLKQYLVEHDIISKEKSLILIKT